MHVDLLKGSTEIFLQDFVGYGLGASHIVG